MNLCISRKNGDGNKIFHNQLKQCISDFISKYFNGSVTVIVRLSHQVCAILLIILHDLKIGTFLRTSNQLQNVRIAFNRVVECILYSFVVIISCFKPYTDTPNENTILA
ncbi:hypothetical protein [Bartonella melophagi]|nr:hypothetical protein [Bartonella melophagi]